MHIKKVSNNKFRFSAHSRSFGFVTFYRSYVIISLPLELFLSLAPYLRY